LFVWIFFNCERYRRLSSQRLPLIGQQFSEAIDRMPHDPAEYVVEVFPGIDIAVFAGLDQTHVERRRVPATLTADKEPIRKRQTPEDKS
jgi:hypothetical protein